MDVDVGLDAVGLTFEAEAEISVDAARLGYGRIWTGSLGDPFQTCALRWAATRAVVAGGIGTAIGVLPLGMRTPADLALSAAALSQRTDGRFVLGVGAGSTGDPAYRRTWGVDDPSPLSALRAHLTALRSFLAGGPVTARGPNFAYDGARIPVAPTRTPLYVGAAGPEMVRLAGELADGIYLSWCTAEDVAWARERIGEGAGRAGRQPGEVTLAASVRVCVDDEGDVARRALAEALLPYVIGWGGSAPSGFRRSFERMGFAADIAALLRMQERGADRQRLVEEFPEHMLGALGYFGPASGAAAALRRQVAEADVAVVRLVPARPDHASTRAILEACQPAAAS
jgi:alkanesulfonate monooxygenase SsuD/methylene tetrahydromethanopterin reductase-like flavin-dependent oxidoreductase (luciferase family)